MTAATYARRQGKAWLVKRLLMAYQPNSIHLLLAVFMVVVVLVSARWTTVSYWLNSLTHSVPANSLSLGLEEYQLLGEPVQLEIMSHNASGLTYNPDTDTLFAIANNPTYIVELTKLGEELRKIPLAGFDDTEGLVYLGDSRFALVEEDRRTVVTVTIDDGTQKLQRAEGKALSFAFTHKNNKGFEGVAFNPVDQSLFVVNEQSPRELYHIQGAVEEGALNLVIASPWKLESKPLGNRDLSGLHFSSATGNLLLLSDESKALTETNLQGQVISRLSLRSGTAGFKDSVPQAEGVTMDNDGHLYILSEPNLFYRLAPPRGLLAAQ